MKSWFLLVSLAVLACFLVAVASGQVVIDCIDDLDYDENKHLAGNYLLITSDDLCSEVVNSAFNRRADYNLRTIVLMSAEVQKIYFPDEVGTDVCNAVALDRGVPHDSVHLVIPENLFSSGTVDTADRHQVNELTNRYHTWLQEQVMMVELGFINWTPQEADMYWVPLGKNGEEGEEVHVGVLGRKERNTQWQTTTLGHYFRVRDKESQEILWEGAAEFPQFVTLGDCKFAEPQGKMEDQEVARQVHGTFQSEWQRSNRVTRTFTELGFAKARLPEDLYASIQTYYYNNQRHLAKEEWNNKGVYVNWWEVQSYMIGMPWKLKTYWQSRLKILVQNWAGVSLELTDIYGMRRYEDGARLLTHVDREETHAASLIINVAQGAMRKPWMLEIYDFAHRLHEVEMTPGDIVYYESARCLHGRMSALKGEYYVNLFAHYRPTGDPQWYVKENPEDAPPPLLDNKHMSEPLKNLYKQTISPQGTILQGPRSLYQYWFSETRKAQDSHGFNFDFHGEL